MTQDTQIPAKPEPAAEPKPVAAKPRVRETDQPGVVLREHEYDGIQEYDQKLPNWWLFTFYIMVVFFVVYWVFYYRTSLVKDDYERLEAKMAAIESKKSDELDGMLASLNDDALWEMSRNDSFRTAGEKTFMTNCVACHAADLSGMMAGVKLPGQPLNDGEWKYGGNPMDVYKVVSEGSPDLASGMIPWKHQLGPKQIAEVVAFVMSHHEPPGE